MGTVAILLLLAGLATWEWLAPRQSLTTSRLLRWPTNITLGCLNLLLTHSRLAPLPVAVVAAEYRWGLLNTLDVPSGLSIVVTVLLIDLLHYALHRANHAVPLLWRVHRVHHADRELDYTSGFRFHPVEALTENVVFIAVVAVLGLPPAGVLVYGILATVSTLASHGNGRVPAAFDRALGQLLVTPDMHRLHHSVRPLETDSNFATVFCLWDRLLGTHRAPRLAGGPTVSFGLMEFQGARYHTIPWTLALPFLSPNKAREPRVDDRSS